MIHVKLNGRRNPDCRGALIFRLTNDWRGYDERRGWQEQYGVLIGAAVVAVAVLAYYYYQRSREPVVKIDVPGFQGEIRKDNGGVDVEVGKPKH